MSGNLFRQLALTVLSFLSCYILYFCFMIRRRTAKKSTKEGPVERDSFASLDEQSSWFEPRTSYPPSTATHTQAEENVNTPIVGAGISRCGFDYVCVHPRTESALADGTLTQGMEEGRNRESILQACHHHRMLELLRVIMMQPVNFRRQGKRSRFPG